MAAEKKEPNGSMNVGGKAVAVAMSAMMVWSQAGYATTAVAEEVTGSKTVAAETLAGG